MILEAPKGLEPLIAELQSAALPIWLWRLESRAGFEPAMTSDCA